MRFSIIYTLLKKPVGSIVIVKADDSTAQLRYFLIEPEIRGKGLGQRLVKMALAFCRKKSYNHVFLETISSLKTARHIYKDLGFTLINSQENPTWGENIMEEHSHKNQDSYRINTEFSRSSFLFIIFIFSNDYLYKISSVTPLSSLSYTIRSINNR